MVKREEFLQILKDHPLDYEKFCYLRDLMLVYNDSSKLGIRYTFKFQYIKIKI